MDPSELTLNGVTYEWLDKETNPKSLKKALKLLKDDGNYFPDLSKAIDEKLQSIDEKYKKLKQSKNEISQEDIEKSREKLYTFEEELKNADKLLQEAKGKTVVSSETIQLKRKKEAENEKFKGNEMMKTKEYEEAIRYYTRSISIDEFEPTTYCNRALAYIKSHMYNKALEDCNQAIKLKNNYIKAFYRRHICYAFQKHFILAFDDLLYVLSDNPKSSDILKDIDVLKEKWISYDKDDYNSHEADINIKIEKAKNGNFVNQDINDDKTQIKVNVVNNNIKEDNSNAIKVKISENNDSNEIVDKNEEKKEDKKEEKSNFRKIVIQEDDDDE